MDKTPTFQWSKFSPDKSEQFVVRTDTWDDLVKGREWVLGAIPTTNAFPNDSGPKAHSEANTQSPVCGVHGTAMTLKPAGVSKAGRQYPAFWSCPTKNADNSFCSYKPPKEQS